MVRLCESIIRQHKRTIRVMERNSRLCAQAVGSIEPVTRLYKRAEYSNERAAGTNKRMARSHKRTARLYLRAARLRESVVVK